MDGNKTNNPDKVIPDAQVINPELTKTININKSATIFIIIGYLFLVLPLVGLAFSILGYNKTSNQHKRWKTAALVSIALNSFLIFLAFISLTGLFLLSGGLKSLQGNSAHNLVKPLEVRLVDDLGGTKICDEGDSGYGIDNTQPWYEVYYLVNDNNIEKILIEESSKIDVMLSESKEIRNYYEDSSNYEIGLDPNRPYIEPLKASILLNGYEESSKYYSSYKVSKEPSYTVSQPILEARIDYKSENTTCIVNGNEFSYINIPDGKAMVSLHSKMPNTK